MAAQRRRPDQAQDRDRLAAKLLRWFDRHARILPWRARPGRRPDPYVVWLSEIMLQQTTVATVGPYFESFRRRWPDVAALAAAPLDDVLKAWAGLGYYARARNLHRCAVIVSREHGGRFPDTEAGLRALPGIGDYTAAAIMAIAFDQPAAAVDGNVERVLTRLAAIAEPLPRVKPRLRAFARSLVPAARAGDYAQAVMDLGATICTPRRPRCKLCPWADDCAARRAGNPEDFPRKLPKRDRPTRHGVAFWLVRADGAVWLRRRPERGLLGGMSEVPSTEWQSEGPPSEAQIAAAAPLRARWTRLPGVVHHGFTHFDLELEVRQGRAGRHHPKEGWWCPLGRIGEEALPTLMRKVVAHALAAGEAAPAGRFRRAPRD